MAVDNIKVDLDVVETMKNVTVSVKVQREKELMIRLRIALLLIRLAVWIAGMKFKFDGITKWSR